MASPEIMPVLIRPNAGPVSAVTGPLFVCSIYVSNQSGNFAALELFDGVRDELHVNLRLPVPPNTFVPILIPLSGIHFDVSVLIVQSVGVLVGVMFCDIRPQTVQQG